MSLMGMRRAVKQYGTPIWITLAGAMVVTSLVGFGSYWYGDRGTNHAQAGASEPPVATVGGTSVRRSELDQMINQFSVDSSPLGRASTSLMVLEQLKRQEAAVAAAKKAGITVTDADLDRARERRWQSERASLIQGLSLKPEATDADINRALPADAPHVDQWKQRYPEEELRSGAYVEKLQAKLEQEAKAQTNEQAVRNSYADIRVRHILINFGPGALPEEQARAKAQKILDAVKADPSKMPALADANTSDPGNIGPNGKKRGGFYDWQPASTYVPAFAAAAQSLKPGQVYPQLVRVQNSSYSGFHIVKLEGTRTGTGFPKDFEKKKKDYIEQHARQVAQQKLMEAVEAALPTVRVQVSDPVLRAAQFQQEANKARSKADRDAALKSALNALNGVRTEESPAAPFLRAALYETLGDAKNAIAAHREAIAYSDTLDSRLALARLYLREKNKVEALKEIQEAEGLVRDEVFSQQEIANLYKQVGRADLSAAATKKYQEMARREQEQNRTSQPTGGGSPVSIPVPLDKSGGKPGSGG